MVREPFAHAVGQADGKGVAAGLPRRPATVYESAARLSASNSRISDIYRADGPRTSAIPQATGRPHDVHQRRPHLRHEPAGAALLRRQVPDERPGVGAGRIHGRGCGGGRADAALPAVGGREHVLRPHARRNRAAYKFPRRWSTAGCSPTRSATPTTATGCSRWRATRRPSCKTTA